MENDINNLTFIPVGRAINLTNQHFGRWMVLGRAPNTNNRRSSNWWCRCECGNIKSVRQDQLTRGISTSCGCYALEIKSQVGTALGYKYGKINGSKNKKDLSGQIFGHLVVIEDTGKRIKTGNGTNVVWKCQCNCGKITEVAGGHLTSGHTQSCGCLQNSRGVETIIQLLTKAEIPFIQEFKINDFKLSTGGNPRFDFYVNNKYFIEYDGEQHFDCKHHGWNDEKSLKLTQQRDKEKNEWCLKNHIPLIRIPYTKLNTLNIEDLILETTQFKIE